MFKINALINKNYNRLLDDYVLVFFNDVNMIICFILSMAICFGFKNSHDFIIELKK